MKKLLLSLFLITLSFSLFAGDKTYTQIEELYGNAIVTVNVFKKDGSTNSGTGFIINSDGFIATAGHVVKDSMAINVTFKNGVISKEAKIISKTKEDIIDLAILKIPNENLPSVVLEDKFSTKAGQEISVIGNPRRLQNTITNGLISQLRQITPEVIWLQISAPISPSSSGSPVFNKEGKVIGIAVSSLKGKDTQNINFAIPSTYLATLMKQNDISYDIPKEEFKKESFFTKVKNYIICAWEILKSKIKAIFN